MNIYISGICGTGMGALAEFAHDAGYQIFGSDLAASPVTDEVVKKGIEIEIGSQDGSFLKSIHGSHKLDLFVYTSSLPASHPELLTAQELGIKTVKRDQLINLIIEQKNLKLIAISGTHGKTTTTAIAIWLMHELSQPVSYLIGSTLPFGPAGQYRPDSKYLIYEADEYDRNFLHFHPYLAIIPSVSYDHSDTYPTQQDYLDAFATFRSQSQSVIENITETPGLTLPGSIRRYDASLAISAINRITGTDLRQLASIANRFPGVGRRFERIANNVYSDYAHHHEEISATIELAREVVEKDHFKGLVVLYEPHQNTRQHTIKSAYKDAFAGVDKLFWLPTYLTREDPNLPTLSPQELSEGIPNTTPAQLDDTLAEQLKNLQIENYLILLMTAGPADAWLRSVFNHEN